jgi:hypothetical protein
MVPFAVTPPVVRPPEVMAAGVVIAPVAARLPPILVFPPIVVFPSTVKFPLPPQALLTITPLVFSKYNNSGPDKCNLPPELNCGVVTEESAATPLVACKFVTVAIPALYKLATFFTASSFVNPSVLLLKRYINDNIISKIIIYIVKSFIIYIMVGNYSLFYKKINDIFVLYHLPQCLV